MNKKFVRQAQLPDAAYPPKFDAFSYYAEKASDEGRGYVRCEGSDNINEDGRCITNVNMRQEEYSKQHYNKILCWNCQKKS